MVLIKINNRSQFRLTSKCLNKTIIFLLFINNTYYKLSKKDISGYKRLYNGYVGISYP